MTVTPSVSRRCGRAIEEPEGVSSEVMSVGIKKRLEKASVFMGEQMFFLDTRGHRDERHKYSTEV